ncbi:MAG: hypothetical protein H6935_01325 [Thiobacillus sp.]|nr:hypothetical protein [Thiobacillus sp.]
MYLFLAYTGLAQAATEEDLFFKSIADVNEGELKFLTTPTEKPVHHHQNRITIDDASLETGWIHLEQCHSNLDAVPTTQVIYREESIRGLEVLRAENIGRAWVEGPSIQLENVSPNALLCIKADTRALSSQEGNSFFLRNGPYHRRFLDGYYPMRVSLSVHLTTPRLRFAAITPAPQPGLQVTPTATGVEIDALFEGRLRTEIRFDLAPP